MNSNLQHLALEQAGLLISNQEAGNSSGHLTAKLHDSNPGLQTAKNKTSA